MSHLEQISTRATQARRKRHHMTTRGRIIAVLDDYWGMPLTVNELAAELNLSKTVVLQNVRLLRERGVIKAKEGDSPGNHQPVFAYYRDHPKMKLEAA